MFGIRINVENKLDRVKDSLPLFIERLNEEVGLLLLRHAQRTFDLGGPGWDELTEMAIREKGARTPLIDTGRLRAAITLKRTESGGKIGVFDGPALKYAHVHEFGALIPVTERMRKFFIKKHKDELRSGVPYEQTVWKPLKKDTEYIDIPPRPFLRTALHGAKREIDELIDVMWKLFILQVSV